MEESIVNHPNFEKAAALIQMLGDDRFDANTQHPHRIGSLPSGRTPFAPTTDVQTIEAAVNIVRDVIEAKEARKQTEKEEEEEFEELEEEEELPEGKGRFKRRQISVPAENLNLDRPDESKSVKPYVINIYLDTKQGKVFKDTDLKEKIKEFWEEQHKSAGKEEEIEEADEAPARNPRKNEVKDYLSESVPRYQIENIAKMYPDPTSTANPHTERLESGAPANYDINKKIKEVIATVTPVNHNGFSKYLTFWRQMWNKKQEAKEAEERLAAEIPEDDPPKQAMKRIENDEVFMKNQNKNQNQRHYSTFPQPYSNVFIAPDDSLKCKSKATTHLQIMELHNFRSDPKSSSGANPKLTGKSDKNDTSRVEEFVDKLKSALASENNSEFKKINVVYGQGNSSKPHKGQVKVKISKIIEETKSECDFRETDDDDNAKKIVRKSQSAKKK